MAEWIHVKDKHPENGEYVWVYTEYCANFMSNEHGWHSIKIQPARFTIRYPNSATPTMAFETVESGGIYFGLHQIRWWMPMKVPNPPNGLPAKLYENLPMDELIKIQNELQRKRKEGE